MNALPIIIWIGYAAVLLYLTWLAKSTNALMPGKIGAVVQAFAYVATYVSGVALIGFAGLGHSMGMQIQFVTLGCVWFGCWMVYRYIAWPTKLLQRKLGAQTPIEMLAKGFASRGLGKYYGLLSGPLILVYCSAVFKGGAAILTTAVPLTEPQAFCLLVAIVAVSVLWGGLRAVLYTEALQGLIMALGVAALFFGAVKHAGGLATVMESLAALPPTPQADNGLLALSSGPGAVNIISLMLVTSVGVWAQPQLIQRHFALKSRAEAHSIIPMVMLIIAVLLGGALFVGGMSRVLLGSASIAPDQVIPAIVRMVLPEAGIQLFALAIVSASLSTASALLHVAAATLGQDVLGGKLTGWKWRAAVLGGALASGVFGMYSSSIIAVICATSWTLVAAAMWIPYMALVVMGTRLDARTGWSASLCGTIGAVCWYVMGYAPTAMQYTGMAAPGILGHMHPMLIGAACSMTGLAAGLAARRAHLRHTQLCQSQ